jgi:hypothetical protein
MNAVSIEAKAVLAFMEDVHKLRALSAEVGATDPTSAAETHKLNLQIAGSLRRQRKLLQELLDRGGSRLKSQHLHIPHVGQCTKLVLNGVGHELIDAHDGNGILPGGLTTQMESSNIDARFRQEGAQGTDEARLV